MTRTPFFWALSDVRTAFGAVSLASSIDAAWALPGNGSHRRAGWR